MSTEAEGRLQSADRGYTPTPREGCPEQCGGHFAPCEHLTGLLACDVCVEMRQRVGPIFCEGVRLDVL